MTGNNTPVHRNKAAPDRPGCGAVSGNGTLLMPRGAIVALGPGRGGPSPKKIKGTPKESQMEPKGIPPPSGPTSWTMVHRPRFYTMAHGPCIKDYGLWNMC